MEPTETASVMMTLAQALGVKPSTLTIVACSLFLLSEGLSMIKKVKANGVFQLVAGIVSSAASKVKRND